MQYDELPETLPDIPKKYALLAFVNAAHKLGFKELHANKDKLFYRMKPCDQTRVIETIAKLPEQYKELRGQKILPLFLRLTIKYGGNHFRMPQLAELCKDIITVIEDNDQLAWNDMRNQYEGIINS